MTTSARYMVETQVKPRGVKDPLVLEAIESVNRSHFVPKDYRRFAFSDCPLPISEGQTISQPYMVAAMTEYLRPHRDARILEIGTGSGYQTAVLAKIVKEVYTVEIIESLGTSARELLSRLHYTNIRYKIGDGFHGWAEHGPYDGIIVTAAPESFPSPLGDQLVEGGRLVLPIGPVQGTQSLYVYNKQADGSLSGKSVMDVRFVPLTGSH